MCIYYIAIVAAGDIVSYLCALYTRAHVHEHYMEVVNVVHSYTMYNTVDCLLMYTLVFMVKCTLHYFLIKSLHISTCMYIMYSNVRVSHTHSLCAIV